MVRLVSAYRDRIEGMKAAHRIYRNIDKGGRESQCLVVTSCLQCLVWTELMDTCGGS